MEAYRDTDRFQNWFITSLQTDINDTTASFRLNKALNVTKGRLVIDPYDESNREIVKIVAVDGTLVYVERGDDHTEAAYHNEGAIVVMDVFAGDLNDLYAEVGSSIYVGDTPPEDPKDGDLWGDTSDSSLNSIVASVGSLLMPIGSIYVNKVDNRNPAVIFGFGTWVALEGYTVVGRKAGDTDFGTAGNTVGAKTHTLTEAQLPALSGQFGVIVPGGHGSFRTGIATSNGQMGNATYPVASGSHTTNTWSYGIAFGSGQAHNNIQPSVVAYMWERVA